MVPRANFRVPLRHQLANALTLNQALRKPWFTAKGIKISTVLSTKGVRRRPYPPLLIYRVTEIVWDFGVLGNPKTAIWAALIPQLKPAQLAQLLCGGALTNSLFWLAPMQKVAQISIWMLGSRFRVSRSSIFWEAQSICNTSGTHYGLPLSGDEEHETMTLTMTQITP